MLIGYARVSTIDQNLENQTDLLKQAGCELIFADKITGTKFDRPKLNELKKTIKKGDVVVVWKLDRLGRGLRDLINLMQEFEDQEIGFKSLTEGIDTTTTAGRLIFHIFASLAEFERALIVERTQAGLRAGRARGRIGGRPKLMTDSQIELMQKMHADKTVTIKSILETFKINRSMMYRYLNTKKPPRN
jgi:DNA invertase Pin-like site-specific DNA recombinase